MLTASAGVKDPRTAPTSRAAATSPRRPSCFCCGRVSSCRHADVDDAAGVGPPVDDAAAVCDGDAAVVVADVVAAVVVAREAQLLR